jgi:hypothetical protein
MLINRVVVNSSPLITLFNSGQAELLPKRSNVVESFLASNRCWMDSAQPDSGYPVVCGFWCIAVPINNHSL